MRIPRFLLVPLLLLLPSACARQAKPPSVAPSQTVVSIDGENFLINGQPTLRGRSFQGHSLEGLLPNARLVQATFDDLNPQTRSRWSYPDGTPWSAEKNTRDMVAALPSYRAHGLLAFTINLQGGNPYGYGGGSQIWINSAFENDGSLRPAFMQRAQSVIEAADRQGMVVILGLFYAAQQARFHDEAATLRAVDNAADWITSRGYTNVLVEIANECDMSGFQPIVRPNRVAELIRRAQERSTKNGLPTPARRLLVSVSLAGGRVPTAELAAACDFILLHGNGVSNPDGVRRMIAQTRALPTWAGKPILINEDDHYNFDQPDNNLLAAFTSHVSWGLFDYRRSGESFADGFQSVPTDWTINAPRKEGFFTLVQQLSGL
jgi:hypothetical protein